MDGWRGIGMTVKGWHEGDNLGDEIVLYLDLGGGHMNLQMIK